MHKRYTVMAVLAVVWGVACATKSKGTEPGEPETVTMESPGAGAKSDQNCQSELTIDVDPDGSDGSNSKRFDPRPDPVWTMCDNGSLKVKNDLSYPLCLVILNASGRPATKPMSLPVSDDPQDVSMPTPGEDYKLAVCGQKGSDCSSGCDRADAGTSADHPDTIKGNLSIITSM